MRPRIALTIVLCLLAVSATLPLAAEEGPLEKGRTQIGRQSPWSVFVAWIGQVALTIDPNGSRTEASLPVAPPRMEVAQPGDLPAISLDADPNG